MRDINADISRGKFVTAASLAMGSVAFQQLADSLQAMWLAARPPT
jgi:hypothetical protein